MHTSICPDPTAMATWHRVLAATSVLMFLTTIFALFTLWRVRLAGTLAVFVTAVTTVVVAATAFTSTQLWTRLNTLIATLTAFYPKYPSSCMTADDFYGHFSPPPVFYEGLLRTGAKVAPLERAAAIDVVVALAATAAIGMCALVWRQRRLSISPRA